MEAASDILLILKNYQNIISELDSYEKTHFENLKNALNNITGEVEALRKLVEDKENGVKVKERDLKDLESSLSRLNDKLNHLKTVQEKKLKEKEQLTEDYASLISEVEKYEANVKNLEKVCLELDKKIRVEEEKLEKAEHILNDLKTEIEKENKTLQQQRESELNELNRMKSLHKAVKYLLDNKMLKTPEYAIIEALIGKSTVSLDYIQKTTLTKIDVVKNVVKALEKRGLLELNESTGQIKILKDLTV
ncbi:MAG: hypothetical protein OdinLCB4_007335 [Candidatus Odinarchaeum yellowstonii]|uniref:Uncharacterized protein n=1 Tax=Odinarchaeota yellowstonii (strain LCB_4) TaxID=1841599 RepID=A0AAF0IBD8_ODILC|nr:MAG: hypothetical protein OdinLCB4_007335 [Candidatus Odinarchaeum yellowstonii]